MSILFSRHCEYALQAVSYLALQPKGRMASIKEMTKLLKIPYHFLAKILQDLVYKGLLISQKGPGGGFALATVPEKITLFHIVEAIDGTDFANRCVMGFSECSGKNPCAAHERWKELRENIYSMLFSESIAEMVREMKKLGFRSKGG